MLLESRKVILVLILGTYMLTDKLYYFHLGVRVIRNIAGSVFLISFVSFLGEIDCSLNFAHCSAP